MNTQTAPRTMRDAIAASLESLLAEHEDAVLVGGPGLERGPARRAFERFGSERFLLGPDEGGTLVGAALGLALGGLRPVVEIDSGDQLAAAFEVLTREIATWRSRAAGSGAPRLLLRVGVGAPESGATLGHEPESWLAATPGLRVVAASGAASAAALIRAGFESEDPTVILEPRALLDVAADEDEGEPTRIDRVRVLREGGDATLVAWGSALPAARAAAEAAAARGMEVAVVDLVSLAPLDSEGYLEAVARSGRVVVVQPAPRSGGIGAELAALAAERAIERLEAPVLRVAAPDAPTPERSERGHRPDAERVLRAVENVIGFQS